MRGSQTRLAVVLAAAALALTAVPIADAFVVIGGRLFVDNFIGNPNEKTCPTLVGDPDNESQRPAVFELVEIATIGNPDEREALVAADRNLDGVVCGFLGR